MCVCVGGVFLVQLKAMDSSLLGSRSIIRDSGRGGRRLTGPPALVGPLGSFEGTGGCIPSRQPGVPAGLRPSLMSALCRVLRAPQKEVRVLGHIGLRAQYSTEKTAACVSRTVQHGARVEQCEKRFLNFMTSVYLRARAAPGRRLLLSVLRGVGEHGDSGSHYLPPGLVPAACSCHLPQLPS